MSDAMVPSYRVQRESSGVPWIMFAVAGGLLAAGAVGAGGWWAFQRIAGGPGSVPVVEADARPFKVRPDDPGGLRVPNQNALILERPGQRQSPAMSGRSVGLVPDVEAPNLALLRAAVAPPANLAPQSTQVPESDPGAAPQPDAESLPLAEAEPQAVLAGMPLPPPAAPPLPARNAVASSSESTGASAALPAPVAGGRVMVQLAAVGSEEGARGEWDRLARRNPELFQGRTPVVQRLEREGRDTLYRLRASGFADQDSAGQFCEQARGRGLACIPVR